MSCFLLLASTQRAAHDHRRWQPLRHGNVTGAIAGSHPLLWPQVAEQKVEAAETEEQQQGTGGRGLMAPQVRFIDVILYAL